MRSRVIWILAAIISLASCSKEPAKELSFSTQNIEMHADGQAQSIGLNANVQWNISASNAGWLSISPKSGEGSSTIQFTSQPNISGVERVATVTASTPDDEVLKSSVTVKQLPVSLTFSPEVVKVKSEGEEVSFKVISNTEWEISISEETARATLSQTKGTGDATIKATVTANPNNRIAKIPLKFNYHGIYKTLYLEQEPGPNTTPAKPVFTNPKAGAEGVYTNVTFKWDCSDADGDTLNYYLYLSTDGNNFTEYGPYIQKREAALESNLTPSTTYYAKLKADDLCGGVSESDIITFKTSHTALYADGEYYLYQKSTKEYPIRLIVTGDGFQKAHYEHGGLFDSKVKEGIEGLFSVEPYKSYREYFSVYVIAAYSTDAGATISSDDKNKNTVFSSVIKGGGSTGIECNYDNVFEWVKKIPDINDSELKKTSILLLINENIYAGTCASWIDGKSIAMVPIEQGSRGFVNTLVHEYGGHGFGRLADEYINNDTTIPQSEIDALVQWQERGYNWNVSTTSDNTKVPWNMFIGLKDYNHVSVYQGGYYYKYGVWRSEQTSCMIDNRLYFNTISRYSIVKRIMDISCETQTLEEFIVKDVEKRDNTETKAGNNDTNFIPLGKPILFKY